MRVLVEQTEALALTWIENLRQASLFKEQTVPSVHVMMGGNVDVNWDIDVDKDMILIGTQDQLLSRALNRGYAMSRFRWPVHFGLLNNDCLWVFDEVQLMGVGLATSVQLQAFRESLGTIYPVHSIWMSATLQKEWLDTVDFSSRIDVLQRHTLELSDRSCADVERRLNASKPIEQSTFGFKDIKGFAKALATEHTQGSRTMAVLNSVARAQELFREVMKLKLSADIVLIHSRFRPPDRKHAIDRLLADPGEEGLICIATQVVEAGVDIDCRTLFTELAPWASLIQRFGRCNRYGNIHDARIFWIDIDTKRKGGTAPYKAEELESAKTYLLKLSDAMPFALPRIDERPVFLHVIRKKDLIELFDTTPDLAGMDIDVSRFIRSADDRTAQVFWRKLDGKPPKAEEPAPGKDELCSIPIDSLSKDNRYWLWDSLDGLWRSVVKKEIYPGVTILMDSLDGGYAKQLGWTGAQSDKPECWPQIGMRLPAYDDDNRTVSDWLTIAVHTDKVAHELTKLLDRLSFDDPTLRPILELAVRWHDAGKAHSVFQQSLSESGVIPDEKIKWAKAPAKKRLSRKGFRHELASALSLLQAGKPDLAAYLAAAHHGKIRISIRSLPDETIPSDSAKRFARGIWDGDVLEITDLGNGEIMRETTLDLAVMELGINTLGESWLSRMLRLRDDPEVGPFRLSFLEALIRIADWRGSAGKGGNYV